MIIIRPMRLSPIKEIIMEAKINLQDVFLNALRKEKMPVTVFLTNGFQQKGIVNMFDGYTVMLLFEGKQYLIYKHAISTIVPQKSITMPVQP